MALVAATEERIGVGFLVYTWAAMQLNDTGAPVVVPAYPDKTVQVEGTYGSGGAVTIQGSNYTATPTWATLNNPAGTPLVMLSGSPPHIQAVLEHTYQIRPNVTAGDGTTALTVKLAVVTLARH